MRPSAATGFIHSHKSVPVIALPTRIKAKITYRSWCEIFNDCRIPNFLRNQAAASVTMFIGQTQLQKALLATMA